jgi:hypothetical protein
VIENIKAHKKNDPFADELEGFVTTKDIAEADDEGSKIHGKLYAWFTEELSVQSANRYQQSIDADFYDSIQWSDEDAEELRQRGQAPLVINQIKPAVDWVIGTEKRTRVDFKVLPREADDTKGAEVKSKLMKYVHDVNRTEYVRSRAFADAVKTGIGWVETGIRQDPEAEPIYTRYESWRNMLYDSKANELDLSDARYVFRWKWVDIDVAMATYPEKAEAIKSQSLTTGEDATDEWFMGSNQPTTGDGDWKFSHARRRSVGTNSPGRDRIKLIECWYRAPCKKLFLIGEPFNGVQVDPNNPQHAYAVDIGQCEVVERTVLRNFVAVLTEDVLLVNSESPYKHNRFPFVPVWCYRRDRDHAPYGLIRAVRDAQEDLNKRASKALHILASNRVIAEEGAVQDWDELRREVARPDGIIIRNRGKELIIDQDKQLAQQHLALMEVDSRIIREVSGVTSENMGRESNATSGKAILARQEQGSVVTAELFDNYRLSGQILGEIELSLIEQFYSTRKVVRLTSERGALDWNVINDPQPDGTVANDITGRQADFIIGEQDFRGSMRMAMFEQMVEMMGKLPPEVSMQMLDLVVEMSDMPNREEIASRVRKMNGQPDPTQSEPDPEEQQEQQAKAEQAAQAQQMAQMSAQLAMAEQQAKVEKLKAEAQAILANAQPQPQQVEAPQVDMSESVRAEYEQKIAMMKQAQAVQEKMAKQAFDEAQYELRMNFDAQVAALKEQARQTADLVKKEVDRIKQEAASKAASVENTSNVEIEKAKIEADAQKEIARINAQQAEANKDVLAKIDALQKVIEAKGKEKEAKPEPAPAPAPKDDTAAQGMTAAITALTAVVSQLNQPKPAIKIVRDKDGKITGATPE